MKRFSFGGWEGLMVLRVLMVNAEVHWLPHFIPAIQAVTANLYLPLSVKANC